MELILILGISVFLILLVIAIYPGKQAVRRYTVSPHHPPRQAPSPTPDRRFTDLEAANLPYYRRQYLLSQGEMAFYRVLRLSLPPGCVSFAKVRLADLINCSDEV
jgi:hypothetical protein